MPLPAGNQIKVCVVNDGFAALQRDDRHHANLGCWDSRFNGKPRERGETDSPHFELA